MKRTTVIALATLCIVGAAAILLAYFHWHIGQRDSLWTNLISNLVFALIVAPASFLLGRAGVSFTSMQSDPTTGAVVSFFRQHSEVPWNDIIGKARRIDIAVHYYGAWIRDRHDVFVKFFERGGTLRLIETDPRDGPTLTALRKNFFDAHTNTTLKQEIENTHTRLQSAFEDAGSTKARLTTYYFPNILHYSFVLVDERFLYLSVYEQFRGPRVRSSVFGIDLSRDDELKKYWLQTRDTFVDKSSVVLDK